MKRLLFPFLLVLFFSANAQQTFYLNDPQAAFKQAQEYYQKQYYSLGYSIFKELEQDQQNKLQYSESFEFQNIHYYTLVCSLNQDDSSSVAPAKQFIAHENNASRGEMLSYHLAEYYFRQGNYES